MLLDSELFKRTSHIHVAAFSRSVHIKNTSVNEHLLDPTRFKSLKLTLSFLFLTVIKASCTRVYIHTYTHSYRTNAYLFTLCTLVLFLEIKVSCTSRGADIYVFHRLEKFTRRCFFELQVFQMIISDLIDRIEIQIICIPLEISRLD